MQFGLAACKFITSPARLIIRFNEICIHSFKCSCLGSWNWFSFFCSYFNIHKKVTSLLMKNWINILMLNNKTKEQREWCGEEERGDLTGVRIITLSEPIILSSIKIKYFLEVISFNYVLSHVLFLFIVCWAFGHKKNYKWIYMEHETIFNNLLYPIKVLHWKMHCATTPYNYFEKNI